MHSPQLQGGSLEKQTTRIKKVYLPSQRVLWCEATLGSSRSHIGRTYAAVISCVTRARQNAKQYPIERGHVQAPVVGPILISDVQNYVALDFSQPLVGWAPRAGC